ncbi:YhdT family protein [Dongshaea marina]|uniref:YhdT family protein n=1 Tax=Dongshaea marina TaxID=2047966 RepID=UPI001F3AF620|nr:DUF997 family protein [Dongshaea marina]
MQSDRFSIARREAIWSLVLALLYFICWTLSAYLIPASYSLWGLPLWFVTSCMLFPLGFMVLVTLMARLLFTELELGDRDEN